VNALTWSVLGATGLVALADWAAVARSIRPLEYATKPAVMIGLICLALAVRPANATERTFFVIALGLGLVSDVLLMLPRELFAWGLVAALIEHLAYIAGFLTRSFDLVLFAVAAGVVLASAFIGFPAIYRAVRASRPALVAPVITYVAVFIVMVARAGGTGSGLALTGALLFFYSDALLAWNRFVGPVRGGRLGNIVIYHAGQALLVLSLVA
jgi:uncharacterized membrane protein YhhN